MKRLMIVMLVMVFMVFAGFDLFADDWKEWDVSYIRVKEYSDWTDELEGSYNAKFLLKTSTGLKFMMIYFSPVIDQSYFMFEMSIIQGDQLFKIEWSDWDFEEFTVVYSPKWYELGDEIIMDEIKESTGLSGVLFGIIIPSWIDYGKPFRVKYTRCDATWFTYDLMKMVKSDSKDVEYYYRDKKAN